MCMLIGAPTTGPGCPDLVRTSATEQQDVLASYREGANGYARKPVRFAEFSDAVRTLGLFWLTPRAK
jgi:two-component system, response regulator